MTVRILSGRQSLAEDRAFRKIAEFHGLETEIVPEGSPPTLPLLAGGGGVLAVSGATLDGLIEQDWLPAAFERARFVIAYGFSPSGAESPGLKWLTGGALLSVTTAPLGTKNVKIHGDVQYGQFPVSGQSFLDQAGPGAVFSANPAAGQSETYISVNDRPYFVSVRRGACTVFLLAEPTLVDLDMALPRETFLRAWYAQLIALAIFLRTAGGLSCWTAPVAPATFIVDDPYLRARYGFVQYEALLADMRKTDAALSIAFIPYYYRHSDSATIALFRGGREKMSIAVHGCDHTYAEFASPDQAWLENTAVRALERMEAHRDLTGLPFDDVMIFPGGLFSTKAVRALKKSGYGAIVNSTPWPVDCGDDRLTLRDLLDVAVTHFESFPIFTRHYSRDLFDSAFDALFQKPILVVEHHEFFRNGHRPFIDAIERLSALRTRIAWMPLGQALESSSVARKVGDGQYVLRQFTPGLRFSNTTSEDIVLQVEKVQGNRPVDAVFVSGQKVGFEVVDGSVCYKLALRAGETIKAAVICARSFPVLPPQPWKYRAAACLRRRLSEFRDNHLSRSEPVLALAKKAVAFIHRRSRPNVRAPKQGSGGC